MIPTPWRKIIRDLWRSPSRTLLVAAAIAVGVFLVGVVAHMQTIVSADLARSYAEVRPANATIIVSTDFEEELVEAVRRVEGVADAEGRRNVLVRFRAAPDRPWQLIELTAVADYREMRVNLVRPEPLFSPDPAAWPRAAWPPRDNEITLERTSLLVGYLGLTSSRQGDRVELETLGGARRSAKLAGLAYDFARLPATFAGRAHGYITLDTLEWLGEPRAFNELHIVVTDPRDTNAIRAVANRVADQLERAGQTVERVAVHEPGKLPLNSYFEGFTLVLGALGVAALILSTLPIANTTAAIIQQQSRQIGVMKAIGARSGQIVRLYLAMTLAYGGLAVIIAAPLAARAAEEFVGFLSYFLNFRWTGFSVPPHVIALQLAAGLLVPALAGLGPVRAAARMTVRETIASHGAGESPGATAGWLSALGARLSALPRPVALGVKNTARRPRRLALTLGAMTLASALFVAVLSVRAAMFRTFEDVLAAAGHDVEVIFERPYRERLVEGAARSVPGVTAVESWAGAETFRIRPAGGEGPVVSLTGLPADTRLFQPKVVAGRWLRVEDERAVVVTAELLGDEPDLRVGGRITLDIGAREVDWTVVGVVQGTLGQKVIYAPAPALTALTGEAGRARSIRVATQEGFSQAESAALLREQLEARGVRVAAVITAAEQREQAAMLFDIIIAFLMMVAALTSGVGGLSLAGTLSLNVLERTREIGVLRAIGASSGAIRQVVTVEGLTLAVASWAIGVLLAIPLAAVLTIAVGYAFLQVPLTFTFAWSGALLWLVATVGIALVASLAPAGSASRITVRDALAYE